MVIPLASAIVALVVGHPFPVTCHPSFVPIGGTPPPAAGVTHWQDGKPVSIDLYQCQLLGTRVDASELYAAGVELRIAYHEAEEVNLASDYPPPVIGQPIDAEDVAAECQAIESFVPLTLILAAPLPTQLLALVTGAGASDAALPSVYHEGC